MSNIKPKYETLIEILLAGKNDPAPWCHFYEGFDLKSALSRKVLGEYAQAWTESFRDLKSGSRVVICLSNAPEFLGAYFAVLLSGGIPVPVAPPGLLLYDEWLEHAKKILLASEATHLVLQRWPDRKSPSDLGGAVKLVEVLDFRKFSQNPNNPKLQTPKCFPQPDDLAMIQFSSGSTSEPKGVRLTHRRILINLDQITSTVPVRDDEPMVTWLPFFHDMGLIGGFLAPFYRGVPIYIHEAVDFVSNPGAWVQFLAMKKGAVTIGPDFMYRLMAKSAPDLQGKIDLSSLRVCMTGSEPVSAQTCRDFESAFSNCGIKGHVMMPVYGMAEAVLAITFTRPGAPLRTVRSPDEQSIEVTSCGAPLDRIEVQIRAPDGTILGEDRIGRIYFRSPAQTDGYVLPPGQDFESPILEGWFNTGDLGFLNQGELFITGREKDVLIVRGKKIHAIDLERMIHRAEPKVKRAVVSEVTGGKVVVALEAKSFRVMNIRQLKERIVAVLQAKVDVEFENVFLLPQHTLPRTTSGKLRRFQVKEWYRAGKLASLERSTILAEVFGMFGRLFLLKYRFRKSWKRDPFRQHLIDLLCLKTGLTPEKIDFQKPIVDFGLDSIQLVGLITDLEREIGKVDLLEFYQLRTLEDVYQFCLKRKNQQLN